MELPFTGHSPPVSRKGLPVTEVSDYTGFPEMMDGRVCHPASGVHGGILGRRGRDAMLRQEQHHHRPYRYGCR